MQLSETDIKKILNDNLLEGYWILELGIGYVYENHTSGARYSLPYDEIGQNFWKLLKNDVYDFVCQDGQPKEWVNDLITGDVRNLIIGLVSAITSKYEVTLGIAVPIGALILKTGVINYCKDNKNISSKNLDIKKIIANKSLLKTTSSDLKKLKTKSARQAKNGKKN